MLRADYGTRKAEVWPAGGAVVWAGDCALSHALHPDQGTSLCQATDERGFAM